MSISADGTNYIGGNISGYAANFNYVQCKIRRAQEELKQYTLKNLLSKLSNYI